MKHRTLKQHAFVEGTGKGLGGHLDSLMHLYSFDRSVTMTFSNIWGTRQGPCSPSLSRVSPGPKQDSRTENEASEAF